LNDRDVPFGYQTLLKGNPMGLGPTEIILIIVVIVLLFGAKKIPELAKGLGNGLKEFKKATKEDLDDHKEIGNTNKTENKDTKPS
jgi:sec-independent protein translocase protein TatA